MRSILVGLAALGGALAGCVSAPPDMLYVRSELTVQQLSADNDTCMAEAEAAERGGPRAVNDGTVGGAFAGGLAKGTGDVDRFLAAHRACFMRLGYREQLLTAEQQAAFGALRTSEERAAFIIRLSNGTPQ